VMSEKNTEIKTEMTMVENLLLVNQSLNLLCPSTCMFMSMTIYAP